VQVRFDMSNEDSRVSGNKVSDFLKQRSENIGAQRLMEAGFSQQLVKPIDVGDVPVKGNGGRGVLMMSMMLPYMLVLYAVIGGLFVANDSVAGEKERGTLESLLVTPISREELARGKFAAVAAAALVSGILSLVGMLWPFYVKLSAFSWMTEGGAAFTGFQIASMALVLVPLSAMGAGILLTISTIARNQKEAQTWLGPVMMVVSVLSMMSMMMRPNTSVFVAAVPMLGPALVLKQALQSIINPVFIGIAAGTSVVYAVLAVWLAARMFMKESVLLRT
jgi:sodium transport system permease protein